MAASRYRVFRTWTRKGTRQVTETRVREVEAATSQPTSWRLLCHPSLSTLSELEFEIRSSILSRLINRVPQAEWINWYGDLIRDDGGNGMYATEALHASWPHKQSMGDITIGPG